MPFWKGNTGLSNTWMVREIYGWETTCPFGPFTSTARCKSASSLETSASRLEPGRYTVPVDVMRIKLIGGHGAGGEQPQRSCNEITVEHLIEWQHVNCHRRAAGGGSLSAMHQRVRRQREAEKPIVKIQSARIKLQSRDQPVENGEVANVSPLWELSCTSAASRPLGR